MHTINTERTATALIAITGTVHLNDDDFAEYEKLDTADDRYDFLCDFLSENGLNTEVHDIIEVESTTLRVKEETS